MSNAAVVESVLFAALEKPTLAERNAFLDSACGGDAELRRQVEKLLRAHSDAGDFLQKPVVEQMVAPPGGPDAAQALDATTGQHGPAMPRTQGEGSSDDDSAFDFLQPSSRPDALGRLGHYEMLQVLGRGGFGIVFRAFDDNLQRVVAIKVMAPQIATLSPARKRFLREARSSAQVRHENVVQVHEVGEKPLPFLVMEFIPGETLQQKLDRCGPLDVSEVLRLGRQIAEGLAGAHACDLIHRDIKPGNILLEGGSHKAKITDFGLARAADDASISQSGVVAGTPMFMSPEQALGQHHIDQRADLFSLGSVLYQMVSGRPPFRAPTALGVLRRVAEEAPRPIPEIIPETPDWLCSIITKLHAKNPDERFQSAREVADLLADCEAKLKAKQEVQNPVPGEPSRVERRPVAGGRKWVAAAAVLLLSVIALAVAEFAGMTHLFQGQPSAHAPIKPGGDPPEVPPPAIAAFDPAKAKPGAIADYREIHGANRAAFDKWNEQQKADGYVPQSLAAWNAKTGEPRFAAIAVKQPNVQDWQIVHSVESDDLQSKFENLRDRGFYPKTRGLYLAGQAAGFADLWLKGPKKVVFKSWRGNRAQLETRLQDHRDKNTHRPVSISAVTLPREATLYAHVYHSTDGLAWQVDVQLSKAALVTQLESNRAKGYWLVGLNIYDVGGQPQYVAIFIENAIRAYWSVSLDLSASEYEKELEQKRGLGIRPLHVCARDEQGEARYSVIWLRSPVAPAGDLKSKTFPAPPLAVAPFDATKAQEHQNVSANDRGEPVEITNRIGMKLRLIPPGQFLMRPKYDVTISKPFRLATYEVTIAQFRAFVKYTGYKTSAEILGTGQRPDTEGTWKAGVEHTWRHKDVSRGDDYPVGQLSWEDAVKFCEWLSREESKRYRLPTEAEWEWACRAGSLAVYPTGDDKTNVGDYAWCADNADNQSHPVGQKKPNPWGLFDMLGNVSEWCLDWSVKTLPAGSWIDPRGPVEGQFRSTRGGGYLAEASAMTFKRRGSLVPSGSMIHFGLRIVCEVEKPAPLPATTTLTEIATRLTNNWSLDEMIGLGPQVDRLLAKGGLSKSDAEQLYPLAAAYGRGADWQRAAKLFDLNSQQHAESFWDLCNRMSIAAAIHDTAKYEKCSNQIASLVETQTDDPNANIAATAALASFDPGQKRLATARGLAQRLSEKWPEHVGALLARALLRYVDGDTEGAQKLLEQIPPTAGSPHFRIRVTLLESKCAAKRGDQANAKVGLEQATKLLESLCVSGDLGHPDCWPVAESVALLRDAEIAIHGKAITPPLTPKRLAELATIKRTSSLPAAEQVEAVRNEFQRRNPRFDGPLTPATENAAVQMLQKIDGTPEAKVSKDVKKSGKVAGADGPPSSRGHDRTEANGVASLTLRVPLTVTESMAIRSTERPSG